VRCLEALEKEGYMTTDEGFKEIVKALNLMMDSMDTLFDYILRINSRLEVIERGKKETQGG